MSVDLHIHFSQHHRPAQQFADGLGGGGNDRLGQVGGQQPCSNGGGSGPVGGSDDSSNVTVNGGGAFNASDKVFQVNG